MRKSRTKLRKSSSRKRRSRRMPKKSKRVSRRRVSRRRVSRRRVSRRRRTSKYKMDDLVQEKADAGCISGRVGCEDDSLRDWPLVVAPGVPPRQIKDCGDYNWRAPQPGISKWGSGCPPWELTKHVSPYTRAARISMTYYPRRVVAARRDALNNERLSTGEVVVKESAVGTGSPWDNPESRARLCKIDHHSNCKCGIRNRIFWPDSSGWTD